MWVLGQAPVYYMNASLSQQENKEKMKRKLLLSLLGRLGPQLHECEHKSVTGKSKDDTDGSISPAVVVVLQVESSEVVAATGVLAHMAVGSGIRVDQV